ncbi:C4-dicarboxylate ABC transporter permease [Staphylococcus delphini]|uniref:C4-dicarboxylate ABC transporter permease n=1 Tax=Staphylococcus delphini TaxID=53344 RepID=A0A2A4GYM2_9STAP|nr:TIGR00366 family protein [Staphylococcus delphini]PCF56496.1 C4-dicarboxylate ABC transporter permease [Staphylococcus delphini]PCF63410.1 C4-dicarboxylate ABC transporter permease [Staphylococcus delphini]PCF73426.1 C4-dicarboxylate ABC transporter permease [Staphylococcus delphini]HEC2157271.1 YfcC family protein [Staphylococcus delphini]
MKKKWKNLKMPHTYALLMMVIVVAVILTYIIPAGTFERQKVEGQTVVVPDSFQLLASKPAHFLDIFRAIPEGLISGAEIIFYIFLVGGAFGVIHQTGAFEASIRRLMFQLGRFHMLMIPLTMLIFSILGFSIGLAEETIIFVPIGIIIARTLGYDAMTGAAMVILGSASGFIGGMLNPFTVGVAQTVAELPLFSGWGLRTIIYIFILLAAISVVMIYARRVKQQPERSLVFALEQAVEKESDMTEQEALNQRQLLSIIMIVGAIALNVYGIFRYDWSFNEMSANFLLAGIIGGIVGGLGFNGTFDALVEGMKNILFGAMIVGFAKGIIVILEQGQIIDTIVYVMTSVLEGLPPVITIIGMFIFQFFLNFFIPSGSGQALTTMPLLVPISDLLEVNRQITVLAFQYGDAISNSLFPTSAVLMGALAVAQISYVQWLKFVWKLILIWVVICMLAMSIAYLVGY